MSSFKRRTLLNLLPATMIAGMTAGLAGCGFEPVYGPGGTGSALRGRVEVAAPDTIDSYLMVQRLEERLGRPSQPAYRLELALVTVEQGQAITASGDITRYSIIGRTRYALMSIAEDSELTSGEVENFAGYSATGSTVETLAGERAARERLMTTLADQITTQLYSTLELPE